MYEPVDCIKCDESFCKKCLDDWRKKNDSCPTCRNKPIETKQINKKYAAMLRKVQLFCNECKEPLSYEELTTKHFDQCPRPKVECPLGCGCPDIKGIEHLDDCPKAFIQCPRCSCFDLRENIEVW